MVSSSENGAKNGVKAWIVLAHAPDQNPLVASDLTLYGKSL